MQKRIAMRCLWITCAALCVIHFKALYHFVAIIRFPFDITNGEGFVFRDSVNILQGRPIYTDISQYPFVSSGYPPLFAWIAAGVMRIGGVHFAVLRSISLIAFGLIAAILVFMLKTLRVHRLATLAGYCVLGTSIYFYYWAAWARVDTLAAMFSLLSVAWILRSVTPVRAVGAALICGLAFMTKQSALAAFVAIALYLALYHRSRLVYFVAPWLIITAGFFMWMNQATAGEYYRHLIEYNQLAWYPRAFLGQMKNFVGTHLLLIVGYGYFCLWAVKSTDTRLRLILLYATICLGTTISAGREGASSNYFLETISILAIVAAINCDHLIRHADTGRALIWMYLGLMLVHAAVFLWPDSRIIARFNPHTAEFGLSPTREDIRQCSVLNALIASTPGRVVVENPGFALLNGKEVIGNAAILNFLQKNHWSAPNDHFVQTIERQEYALIAFQGEAFNYDVLHATDRAYHELARVNCLGEYEIKVPNK